MWKLSEQLLLQEWTESRKRLSELLGHEVANASVPGGYYTPRVAAAAATSGYQVLFTSEPTMSISNVDGCRVFGRYTARRNTSASEVAAIAAGAKWDRWRQSGMWAATKAAKRVTGKWYLPLRNALLEFKPRKTSKAIS
jgi:hypothetical protein